jgi:hypothetical protein
MGLTRKDMGKYGFLSTQVVDSNERGLKSLMPIIYYDCNEVITKWKPLTKGFPTLFCWTRNYKKIIGSPWVYFESFYAPAPGIGTSTRGINTWANLGYLALWIGWLVSIRNVSINVYHVYMKNTEKRRNKTG